MGAGFSGFMKRLGILPVIVLALWFSAAARVGHAGMVPLSEEELGSVRAADGISFEWDLWINANEDGTPDQSLSNVERRLAINLANRQSESLGAEWLVLKGFTGRINFPEFTLDAFRSDAVPTPYADVARFEDAGGNIVSPYDQPNLLLTFPGGIEIYELEVAAMSLEYGDVPETVDPNNPPETGFFADPDDARSFLGLRISNTVDGEPARLTNEGNMTVYGF